MAYNESNAPYHNDYDEDKKFLKMLFKPRVAVQTRELNQLQTYLQKQVSRIGDHLFEEGSMIIPGEVNYNLEYEYVKLSLNVSYDDVAGQILSDGVVVKDENGLEGEVLDFIDSEDSDPITLYIKYKDSGTDGENPSFSDGSTIEFYNVNDELITNATVDETGLGSRASIERGIYYILGNFVLVDKQSVIIEKYSNTPTKKIGLVFTEELVTSFDDVTLLDNALDTPNYTAPGADRGKIETELKVFEPDSLPENFIELITLTEGEIEKFVDKTQYSVLEETLARRTYDESGDYTVEPFNISLREHPTDSEKIQIGVEAGKAYVKGFEIETTSTRYIDVDKARDTKLSNNSVTVSNYGNYVVVENIYGLPDTSILDVIEFYDNVVSTPGSQPDGSKIAEANVRHVEQIDSSSYRIFVFNIDGNVSDAVSVYVPDTYVPFTGTLVPDTNDNIVYESNEGTYIFRSPYTDVKTLLDDSDNTDTNYIAMRKYDVQADSSGNVILTTSTDEIFSEYSISNYVLTTDGGELIDLTGKVTRGGTPTGKQVTIELGTGYEDENVRVIAGVIKQIAEHKSKTVQNTTLSGASLSSGVVSLGKADIIKINSIIDDDTTNDITERFKLDNGQRRSYYDIGKAILRSEYPTPSGTVTIDFDYFQHSPGDYFSVDSYSTIDYEDIPTFVEGNTEYKLSDCYDFRPRINDDGTGFTGSGSSVGNIVKPSNYITSDITSYLPRIDKLYLDYKGNFGITKGTSDRNPEVPEDPNDSMVLYIINLNPYTFDEKDLELNYIENKRYTMRDIGSIDKRVKNLEYYTILNSLEKKTLDQQILDPDTGNDRFKNGFFTDSFSDHEIGNFNSEEVRCSVDSEDGILRTEFDGRGIDLYFDESSSNNVEQHGDLITLPYTDQILIRQNLATRSININPYDVFTWAGDIKLKPSSDFWFDTRYKDPEIVFRSNTGRRPNNTWRSWALNWSGTRTVSSRTQVSRDTTSSTSFDGLNRTTTNVNIDTERTTETTVTNNVDDKVVSTDMVPYIRPRKINFKGTKFKPLTRVYPYFDNVLVSQHCKPDGGSYGDALVTNASGEIEGEFSIPSSQFKTGTRKFKLLDNESNDVSISRTFGENDYTANGILQTRQKTIVSTMRTTTRITDVSSSVDTETRRVVWRDPLAQSFLIEQEGGVFLSKITIYFETKDDNIPVNLEIREMDNGQPTHNVVPYSTITLQPSQVNTSSDASIGTDFVFETPVYLQEETEYCFVLLADSVKYNVWISRMGERVIGTNKWVSKQPYIGVMFKSQNASTWTESQLEDIKFDIYRAKFTQTSGSASFKNEEVEMMPIPFNPFTVENGSSVVTVNHPYHGFHEGSKATYEGATGSVGIADSDLNKTHEVVSVIDIDTYTIDVGVNATDSTLMGGNVMASSNIQFTTMRSLIRELMLSGDNITWLMNGYTGKSISGSETPYQSAGPFGFINNEDISFDTPLSVYNTEEESEHLNGNKSFEIVAEYTTERDNLSPVIDVNRLGAVGIRNRINYPSTLTETEANVEDIPREERGACRYINRTVNLDNPANTLKVWFDVNKPSTTQVKIYSRVVPSDSDQDINDIDWEEMSSIKEVQPSSSSNYFEEEYEYESSSFSKFEIKIILLSTEEGQIPKIRNLRGLALT